MTESTPGRLAECRELADTAQFHTKPFVFIGLIIFAADSLSLEGISSLFTIHFLGNTRRFSIFDFRLDTGSRQMGGQCGHGGKSDSVGDVCLILKAVGQLSIVFPNLISSL